MTTPPRGLGRGLGALIPSSGAIAADAAPDSFASSTLEVSVTDIIPNPRQPRSLMDAGALAELAASIREHGLIQPLIVTRAQPTDRAPFQLIAGERRWRASQLAGLTVVPVVIKEATPQQSLELALVENIQRADLNALEEAHAFQQMVEEFGLLHEQIAARVGRSRVAVTNTLRLLRLAPAAQQALVDGTITEGHARALLGLDSPAAQEAALKVVNAKGLSVRETEELVRRLSGERLVSRSRPAPSPDLLALEERLRASLGTKVSLRSGARGKGSLVIHYYSPEELDALLNRLLDE